MAKPNCFVKLGFARCEFIVLERFVEHVSVKAKAKAKAAAVAEGNGRSKIGGSQTLEVSERRVHP
jgi:hypothetical protein